MPAKNTIKQYIENACYHIYNRGVDKREIFLNGQDCRVFLYYLKFYLSSPETLTDDTFLTPKMLYKIQNLNLSKEVDLLSFALMPNHFHIQVRQYTKYGIEKLTRRILTAYAQYFNRQYKRIGTLFESTYKGVLLQTEEQFLYLSSYIHRNPMRLRSPKFDFIQFSSYLYYLGNKQADWVKPKEILSYFRSSRNINKSDILSYQSFVESFKENPREILKTLTLENEEEY